MSTRQLTDSAGNVTDTYAYDAFGVLRNKTGDTVNHYLYTGEQLDANTGFYYLRARWMNPDGGRFVTIDPWEGINFSPITLNKYVYANTNPIVFIDPSGEIGLAETMAVIVVISTLAGIVDNSGLRTTQCSKVRILSLRSEYDSEANKYLAHIGGTGEFYPWNSAPTTRSACVGSSLRTCRYLNSRIDSPCCICETVAHRYWRETHWVTKITCTTDSGNRTVWGYDVYLSSGGNLNMLNESSLTNIVY